MPGMVELRGVTVHLRYFTFGPVNVVFKRNTYNIVLGPTGSGKSTLLKIIAGIYRVSEGGVFIDGADVTYEPPENRDVSYVPQGYAIFDHMTVYENIEYGLKFRGVPKKERRRLVQEMAKDLGIDYLLNRRAINLSGGEQQRVALARALVVKPRVLLLDEPLSMLDRDTKERIIPLLKELPGRYGITVIHVTHDWDEAYSLADKLLIINEGKVVEEGDPEQVFTRPSRVFTARFLGFQNVIKGLAERTENGSLVRLGNGISLNVNGEVDGEVYVCIRPEWIEVLGVSDNNDHYNVVGGVVREIIRNRLGYSVLVAVDNDLSLVAFSRVAFKPGEKVMLRIPRDSVHVVKGDN
ncbi:ABC transporter ATP-binding protein [Vulcanisaeta souniana]|uniref:Molybdate/tungstate import ATP-binding protein WtpC n=2 Tax=Vulcanisaeta souniana JCM 11219 TaxID=1293586 RepID=A0ABM8BM86_9CREN|nr:ATP-binding cassette domain-containing protein [Vulcanisaeta souniana]BDR92022.1 ABC transporter ATPase [Vulcanisaeta souniana JCM 11219]